MKTFTTTIVLSAACLALLAPTSIEAAAADARGSKRSVVRRNKNREKQQVIRGERPQQHRMAKQAKSGGLRLKQHGNDIGNEEVKLVNSNDMALHMLVNPGEPLSSSSFGDMSMVNLEANTIDIDAELGIGLEFPSMMSVPLLDEAAFSMSLLEGASFSIPLETTAEVLDLEEHVFSIPLEMAEFGFGGDAIMSMASNEISKETTNTESTLSGLTQITEGDTVPDDSETEATTTAAEPQAPPAAEDVKEPSKGKGKGKKPSKGKPEESKDPSSEPVEPSGTTTIDQMLKNSSDMKSTVFVASLVGALLMSMW